MKPTENPEQAVKRIQDEVNADLRLNEEALDRKHIEQLRQSGATRQQVIDLAVTLVGRQNAFKLSKDLDSYGDWAG